jgi:DNA-binding SARP family transcriptional activator
MSLFVRILGPVDVRHHGTTVSVGAPKRRAVLLALALAANQPVSLDSLVETAWGEQPPASATMNLRSHAHALRSILDDRVVTHSGAYELMLDVDELDSTLFTSLADRGSDALADGDIVGAVAACGEALALWRGPAAPAVPRTPRLDASLAGLQERQLAVLEDYCAARLAGGATSSLVPDLRRHLAAHPFRERAWAALMLAQYRGGDARGALASYADAHATLREQLGVEPGLDLTRLQHAILTRDPQLDDPARRPDLHQLSPEPAGPPRSQTITVRRQRHRRRMHGGQPPPPRSKPSAHLPLVQASDQQH